MEPDVRYTYIGATLVALIAAAVLAILWLTQWGSHESYRAYEIIFVRQSLEGLQVGGDVTMRGIKVGQVVDYTLSSRDINKVTVMVRVKRDTPVHENTVAVVSRTFVTGIARIGLRTPDPPGPLLKANEGQDYPVIKEGTSMEEKIEDVASRLADNGTEALERLNALLDQPNRDAVRDVLVNIRDLTAGLNARLDRIDQTLATVNRGVDAFGRASTSISAAVEKVSSNVEPVAKQTDQALREVTEAAKTIQAQALMLTQQIDTLSQTASLDLHATSRELRVTAEVLDRTLSRYRDPRALIFGPSAAQLGPGEKAK
ncbi:MAG TPA: MlaD family protein [Burkholderiales bacterium]|nr:MlaD family protein [Burkholderiales bacterium]